jgi:hypothetical protein
MNLARFSLQKLLNSLFNSPAIMKPSVPIEKAPRVNQRSELDIDANIKGAVVMSCVVSAIAVTRRRMPTTAQLCQGVLRMRMHAFGLRNVGS